MDEQSLIRKAVDKVIGETECSEYYENAFNEHFDERLAKLTLFYKFDFQAIALHLSFEFPMYEYKISKKAVAFRWYQLHTQHKQISRSVQPNIVPIFEEQIVETEGRVPVQKDRLTLALQMAKNLDEEEQDGFVMYQPRFSNDGGFAIMKEGLQHHQIQAMMNNSLDFDFGLFEEMPECAAPVPEPEKHLPCAQQPETQQYTFEVLDYQSD